MSRNGSGTYTKAIASFSPGGTITASDHNSLWDDIAAEITNSVAADGQTSMTGVLKHSSGSKSAPSLTFGSDTDTGLYLSGANELSIVASASQVAIFGTASATFNVPVLFTQGIVVSATAVFQSIGTTNFVATANFGAGFYSSATANFQAGFIATGTCVFADPVLMSGTATFTKGFLASNTCTFSHPILVSGTATFTKGFIASASSTFVVRPTGPGIPVAVAGATTAGGATLISNSTGISGVSDVSSGIIRFTFSAALADTNYVAIPSVENSTGGVRVASVNARGTSAVDIQVLNGAGTLASASAVFVAVYR